MDKGKKVKRELSKDEETLFKRGYAQGFSDGYDAGLIKGYNRAGQLVNITLSNDLNALLGRGKEEVKK